MSDPVLVHIKKSGVHTSIQDNGRLGVQDQGIPIGGALDKSAMHLANELVGNAKDCPVLEMALAGPTLEFEGICQIAITGANMSPTINGNLVDNFRTLNVKKGDVLSFGQAIEGCRAYLSIGGEWKTPVWLNSQSAVPDIMKSSNLPSQLQEGDSISVIRKTPQEPKVTAVSKRPAFSSTYVVRVVTGPEFGLFTLDIIEEFFEKMFTIGPESNRMGYRLKESLKGYEAKREELSSGIVNGTIQITNAGKPIILMADAQTTGGYPRIANVISDDIDLVAQMKPGDEIKFMLVSY
ncbi:hypothetical protein BFP71_17110 [Roseivirga misakiensis]|uniref:Carboxyltransferase domain-containing protein n=2 Tax=Roseivirga misakiensis TaxID=1563681 RepID=A0A1E5T199_9BACT|nr:hypothetical protein BFP71_17110 [Roseivirga misakiensis]